MRCQRLAVRRNRLHTHKGHMKVGSVHGNRLYTHERRQKSASCVITGFMLTKEQGRPEVSLVRDKGPRAHEKSNEGQAVSKKSLFTHGKGFEYVTFIKIMQDIIFVV